MKQELIHLEFPSADVLISIKIESDLNKPSPPEPYKFKTSIVPDFKVPDGIEKEAAAVGFKLADLKTWKGNQIQKEPFRTLKFTWGHVYSWNTPTRGSATYSYICRTQDTFCFKIGPYQNLNWDFKWDTVSFSDSKQKK